MKTWPRIPVPVFVVLVFAVFALMSAAIVHATGPPLLAVLTESIVPVTWQAAALPLSGGAETGNELTLMTSNSILWIGAASAQPYSDDNLAGPMRL